MSTAKRITRAIAVAGASVVLLLGLTATAAHAAGDYQGCPSGYVCLYPENAGWNGGNPSHRWYYYGSYNLSNQFGIHRFFNNQTGGAKARNCLGYNGTNCQGNQTAGTYWDYNYTPYNSVKLEP